MAHPASEFSGLRSAEAWHGMIELLAEMESLACRPIRPARPGSTPAPWRCARSTTPRPPPVPPLPRFLPPRHDDHRLPIRLAVVARLAGPAARAFPAPRATRPAARPGLRLAAPHRPAGEARPDGAIFTALAPAGARLRARHHRDGTPAKGRGAKGARVQRHRSPGRPRCFPLDDRRGFRTGRRAG